MFGDETNLLAKNRVDTGLRAFILELRPTNADGTSNLTVHHNRYPATLGKIIDPNGGLITTAHDRFFKYGGWTAPMRRRPLPAKIAETLYPLEISVEGGEVSGR